MIFFFFFSSRRRHTRWPRDWSSDVCSSDLSLAEATSTWERLSGFVSRAVERVGVAATDDVAGRPVSALPPEFVEAMDDDLNVAAALAVVHEHVRTGNNALAAGEDSVVWQEQVQVRSMLDVLGLDPLAEPWAGGRGGDDAARTALEALVPALLEERAEARRSKDWARADALRDQLQAAGIHIEDSPDGARWQLAGGR